MTDTASVTAEVLKWIGTQQDSMIQQLKTWVDINSGTYHLAGVERQTDAVTAALQSLNVPITRRAVADHQMMNSQGRLEPVPLGDCLHLSCRSEAARRVLLSIHLDTVYAADSPFQSGTPMDDNRWRGPGSADAKGGLVVMHFALLAFERFVAATGICDLGWDVLVNADEEVGSPGSANVFEELAPRFEFGLLFEPALPDGGLVSSRKGSANFSISVRGRAAHAGRDFANGKNAVVAAAHVASRLHDWNGRLAGVTWNVARIDGGGPFNQVPETAVIRLNVRYADREHEPRIRALLDSACREGEALSGERISVQGDFTAPPKILTEPIRQLLQAIQNCGTQLGIQLPVSTTGGVCDGNRLAAWGVPNIDTLGVRGGNIHSEQEFVELDSLVERTRLTTLLLIKAATEEFRLSAQDTAQPKPVV